VLLRIVERRGGGYAIGMKNQRNAFTLIELLVVIAIIALLIGILLPALGAARQSAKTVVDGTRLQQLGVAIELYQNDFSRQLPQMLGPNFTGGQSVIGALFGGKKGTLPFFGISEFGPSSRPLNPYVTSTKFEDDANGGNAEIKTFDSPADEGASNTGVPIPGFERTDSMYDMIGSSFTLNDHALDMNPQGDDVPTLVPAQGGRMPRVLDTSKTWVLGSHPIYNHEDDGDRGMYWYGSKQGQEAKANLLFLDSHVKTAINIPNVEGQVENTTDDYTFLPHPDWIKP
jgi:prepilin-type N-terminal cleavage/methylation domain-containing protein